MWSLQCRPSFVERTILLSCGVSTAANVERLLYQCLDRGAVQTMQKMLINILGSTRCRQERCSNSWREPTSCIYISCIPKAQPGNHVYITFHGATELLLQTQNPQNLDEDGKCTLKRRPP